MTDQISDDGLSDKALWMAAWLLGLVAGGCLVRPLTYAADGTEVHTEHFVWLLLGAMASAFSACCAVLSGLKAVEQRLSWRPAVTDER